MEVKKSEPINQTTETNQSEPNQSKPTSPQTPDNRQLGLLFRLLLHISISPYLHSPYLCAYLYAYSLPVQVYRSVMTIAHLYKTYPPSPI